MPKDGDAELMNRWKVQDALETYGCRHWGKGYFSISKNGHVTVHPNKRIDQAIDLKELVDQLQARGIQLPILLRFTDILRHRLGEIQEAFQTAIREFEYKSNYCCVYPIKVNQQRQVVEEILDFGKQFQFGLEAGSKPELLAVLALANGQTPIICNVASPGKGAKGEGRGSRGRDHPSASREVRAGASDDLGRGLGRSGGRLGMAPDLQEVEGRVGRSGDPQANPLAPDLQHRQCDVPSRDDQLLAGTRRQDQHGAPPRIGGRPFLPGATSAQPEIRDGR